MDWGIFKRHPYLTAIGAIAVFLVVYVMRSRSGGGGSSSGATSGGASDTQLAQIQAAQNVAQLQSQTAVQVAGLQAGVQQTAIAAQKDVTDTQTAAQLAAILAQTKAQVDVTQIQTTGQSEQAKTYAGIIETQYQTQADIHAQTVDYLTNLTNQQAAIAGKSIDANAAIIAAQQKQQAANNAEVLKHIKDFGGSQNRLALLLSVQGNTNAANTAAAGQTLSSISGDNLLSRIGNAAAGTLATLLA
jgi:hypothetical protein